MVWPLLEHQRQSDRQFAGLIHIKIGGTDCAVTSGRLYDSGNDSTVLFSTVPRFTVGNNYEVDTVGLGGGSSTARRSPARAASAMSKARRSRTR